MSPALHRFGRWPSASADPAGRFAAWAEAHAEALRPRIVWVDGPWGPGLRIGLHPLCRGVEIGFGPGELVEVKADVLPVGPGYLVAVGRLLRAAGEALGIVWDEDPRVPPDAATEAAAAGLQAHARAALEQLVAGSPAAVLLPPHERFRADGLVATPLGPRDLGWLAAAATGALPLHEAFPWPELGITARGQRGRALALLWTAVRWRAPLDDAERTVLREADALLHAAWSAEPNLALPWTEWAELRALLGLDDEISEEVQRRGDAMVSWPPVGYRRHPVDVHVGEGFWVELPGSLGAPRRGAGTWSAADQGRRVEIALRAAGDSLQPALSLHPGAAVEPLAPDAGPRRGAATRIALPGGGGVLRGRVEAAESTLSFTARWESPSDRAWAEHAWRSIRQDAAPPPPE